MIPHQHDTITALATAPGPGGRAIIRISGPQALRALSKVCKMRQRLVPERRALQSAEIALPEIGSPLPAEVYCWPAPRTYTGQDVVEIHTLSCPPLVELLVAQLLQAGTRAALPGEFTLRAFLAGKLDLTRAEAVLGVIEAGSRNELQHALTQLAGGMATPLHTLREDLLNLLADVEASLDFTDEDIEFISADAILQRLGQVLAHLINLDRQLQRRNLTDRPFRVVLIGRPNAGKSSLFNALRDLQGEKSEALVSTQPGTTRDYLVQRLELAGRTVELVDTAGWQDPEGMIEEQAQLLSRQQAQGADLLLLCVEAGQALLPEELLLFQQQHPEVLGVATKCDQHAAPTGWLATSATQGSGLAELRTHLGERSQARREPALAPSWSRCQHHVTTAIEHLRRAHTVIIQEEPTELFALELREAINQLGEMVGAIYSDDLLDRIFSRFCIGK